MMGLVGRLGRHEESLPSRTIEWWARIRGDDEPRAYLTAAQLTTAYMMLFNQLVPDDPDVYYQSYVGHIDGSYGDLIYAPIWKYLYDREGPNDGTVSEWSARWGNWRGRAHDGHSAYVSHDGLVGEPEAMDNWDARAFYRELVHDLRNRGY